MTRAGRVLAPGLLAVLAYVPALLAAPGRMPADSKLYLYLDPGRFLADAAGTFDPRQFAGWVPHQHVAYLWPTGPWFWLFDLLAVPDWIAHRLWIGTLMLAAGLGARWCARLLGLAPLAAVVAALVYQVSLYVLPYVSRTSVMLLPWAGLGWIVAFAIRATRRGGWGDPAAIALVVLTAGAVNATALAMIVPGPVLWLVHTAWRGSIAWRAAAGVALRTGALCLGVSMWWIVMLIVQGRHGVDVLPYSESLADVSSTATSTEVWRGLGYWLFYVRDPAGATTTGSLRYLISTPAIAISFLVPVVCLAGLVWVRWAHRRFAALLVVTGVVLAVGVHPVDDRSPLMRLIAGGDDRGLALALRSSTRALPLASLGLALAAGSMVAACAGWSWSRRRIPVRPVAAGLVGVVVLANLPGLWTGVFVDPALERDQDPPDAWTAAAGELDAEPTDSRILQLPGAEFGAFRWGYTVDQPLPGLTERPLVTRDLLPLGSPAAMDLLFALDDRVQDGVLEAASVAPVARLLGVDRVWLANDLAFDRFRTARPEVVRAVVAGAPGMGAPEAYGSPVVNRPEVEMTDGRAVGDPRVGDALPPVELAPVDEPGTVVRAAADTLVVSGSGEGLVDIAAVGLLADGAAVRYSASLADPTEALERAVALVVTDSNRDRARHWRSSQDTAGYTESTDPDLALLREVPADERLPVFDDAGPGAATHAEQRGPVTATATSYGEPFAYLPEHRPYMAIDGDLRTAWLVGEHADPIGETLRVFVPADTDELRLRQPDPTGDRQITRVRVTAADAIGELAAFDVELDDRSVTGTAAGGQPVELPPGTERVDITIVAVGGGTPNTPSVVAPVGFAEIGHGHETTVEVVRPPHDALGVADGTVPLALAFTRWRVDPMDRWRDDPEPAMVREFDLPTGRGLDVDLTVRVDPRASDRELAELFDWPVFANRRLAGSLRNVGAAAFDRDDSTAWITPFDGAVGSALVIDREIDDPVDSVTVRQPEGEFSRIAALRLRVGEEERLVDVDAVDGASGDPVRLDVVPALPSGPLFVEIAAIEPATTVDRRYGDTAVLPAAIAELEIAGAPATDLTPGVAAECVPLARVGDTTVSATVVVSGSGWLDGEPLTVEPCTGAVELAAGTHRLDTGGMPADGLVVDRVVLDDRARAAVAGVDRRVRTTLLEDGRFARRVQVDGCASGCWLVFGEGWNDAWSASIDGDDLGEPVLIDGGFNGWWLPPSESPVVVQVGWTAQWPLTLALIVSALIALVAVALAVLGRSRTDPGPAADPPGTWTGGPPLGRRGVAVGGAAWIVLPGLLIGPGWMLAGAVGAAALAVTRRRRLPELVTLATVATIGAAVTYLERVDPRFPGGGWPATFDELHGFGMFAAATLLAAIFVPDDHQEPGSR